MRGLRGVDRDRRLVEAAADAHEARELRHVDLDALADLRLHRQVERLVAEIERAARRRGDLPGLDRDRAIDVRDAAAHRQSEHGAAQLGGGVYRLQRIERAGELRQRRFALHGGAPERRRAGDDEDRSAHRRSHAMRRVSAAVDGDVRAYLAAADFALDARGRRQRGQVEVLPVELQVHAGRIGATVVESKLAAQRSAEDRAGGELRVEVRVARRELRGDPLQALPVAQRQLADRERSVAVDGGERPERQRRIRNEPARGRGGCGRLAASGRALPGEVGERQRRHRQIDRIARARALARRAYRALSADGTIRDVDVVEVRRRSRARHFRGELHRVAVDLALQRDRIRPLLLQPLVGRAQIAGERHRNLVDPAPEIHGDRRLHVARAQRHPLDRRARELAGRAVAIGQRAVADLEVGDADGRGRAGRSAGRRCRGRLEFPVAAAVRVRLERNDRLDERELNDLEAPRQHRQQRDLRLDPLRRQHLLRLRPRRIVERHAGQHDLRLQRDGDLHRALHGEVAAGLGLDARGERRDETVRIDGRDGDRDADEQ